MGGEVVFLGGAAEMGKGDAGLILKMGWEVVIAGLVAGLLNISPLYGG